MKRLLAVIAVPAVFLAVPQNGLAAPVTFSTGAVPVKISTGPVHIEVVWPKLDAVFPYVERSFTYGNVTPGSTMTINGQPARVDENGAFFEMVGFSSGSFRLLYEAVLEKQSTSAVREVQIAPDFETSPPDAEELEPEHFLPWADIELEPGDVLVVRSKGPPGLKGTFRIRKLADKLPLAEKTGEVRGIYEGHYRIQPGDKGKKLEISFKLRNETTRRKFKARAPGKLTIRDPRQYQVAVTSYPVTVVKTGPWKGYNLFLPPGVRLALTGKYFNQSRIELDRNWQGWVDTKRIVMLAEGTPPPLAIIDRYLKTQVSSDSVRLVIQVSENIPFEIKHTIEPLTFDIRFYNAIHRVDRFRFDPKDPVVRDIHWRQESEGVVLLRVETNLRWGWGYDGSYDGEKNFVLEIRRPPDLVSADNVFKRLKIVIDPGHAPDHGALGPMGSEEQHTNLDISLKLREALETEGSRVYMIRDSTEGVPLIDRPFMAWENKGDIYISVHSNGLSVTTDPFEKPLGYMNFYYHAHSRPLAEAVHESYRKNFPEIADNGLRWGDLHVCRTTQMPSVLTESAYLILPEQEAMLCSPEGQERVVKTLLEGIRGFLEKYRDIQKNSPAETRARRLVNPAP